MRIRPLEPSRPEEIELVAGRMRATLVEVLGERTGAAMYTMDWLRRRVRQHLEGGDHVGQVFLAELDDGTIAGHAILRIDSDEAGGEIGLFSTVYVAPDRRRQGIAAALLRAGESWMRERRLPRAMTYTAETNRRLIRAFEAAGYAIALQSRQMVGLARTL